MFSRCAVLVSRHLVEPHDYSTVRLLFLKCKMLAGAGMICYLLESPDARTRVASGSPRTILLHYQELFTGVHSNQDLIWCDKLGIYMGFRVHRGS